MSAPALVLLLCGCADESALQITNLICKQMQELRPKLPIRAASTTKPGLDPNSVASELVMNGFDEIVFVPLDLTRAVDPPPEVERQIDELRTTYPAQSIAISHPIGPAVELLTVLDLKLHQTLSAARATELDSLVLAASSVGDSRGSALLSRRVRQWRTHHHLPVQVAYADNSGPSIAMALAALRAQGRRSTAVGALFLAPDAAYNTLVEQALASGAIAVSAPLGCDERLLDLIMYRYAVAALAMPDETLAVNPETISPILSRTSDSEPDLEYEPPRIEALVAAAN
ncbi:MAG: hypothetical protein LBC29_01445 [Propionibacteriaceae bacterium]|jgi:sirohydrochlorin ferrochelatase|nr:hypothetical protein [Propionibacteriaceae bacterium]